MVADYNSRPATETRRPACTARRPCWQEKEEPTHRFGEERIVTLMATKQQDDPDAHKGAIEGDRPTDAPQYGNPHGDGLNDDGLPDDPIAIAEDQIGANEDDSQG
jgi:hypothetical protein